MTIDTIMNPRTPGSADLKAALRMMVALMETIREAGPSGLISGTLYAILMDRMSLEDYQYLVSAIKRTGLVSESAHVLRWTGPELAKEAVR